MVSDGYNQKGTKMLIIKTLSDAERFVTRQQRLGNDVRWDGWDMIFFREAPEAVYSTDGVVRNGKFGFDNRSDVQDDGTWSVDYRNVKRAQRTTRD
jgi:hypothetical protein